MAKVTAYIAAALLGGRVVATQDHDGEVRFRRASYTPFGYRCSAIQFEGAQVLLKPDGTCDAKQAHYVKRWALVWAGVWGNP